MARKNILVITYWDYNEAHIQANVLPNLRILSSIVDKQSHIYLFCLNKKAISKQEMKDIEKTLLPYRIHLLWFHYSHFGIKMMLKFLWLIPYLCYTVFSKRVSQVYAWCTTAGSVGYLVSFLTARPLILESYEPHAEAMVENGHWHTGHIAYKILSYFEKKQAKRASYIIAANGGMIDYVLNRYQYKIPPQKFFVKPACVDLNQFYPDLSAGKMIRQKLDYTDNNIVCLYAGKFGGIYLKEEVFDFFKVAFDYWGKKFRVLLLTAHKPEEVKKYCLLSEVPFEIFKVLYVAHHEVPLYMRAGDFAICPVKPVPTKKYCTPVKDGEYWATGLPVIITKDISDDSDIIEKNEIGAVLKGLNAEEYRNAVKKIDVLLKKNFDDLQTTIRSIALKYRNYEIASSVYRSIYLK